MKAEPERQSYLESVGATLLPESRPADCRFKMVHHCRVLVSTAIALEDLKVLFNKRHQEFLNKAFQPCV